MVRIIYQIAWTFPLPSQMRLGDLWVAQVGVLRKYFSRHRNSKEKQDLGANRSAVHR